MANEDDIDNGYDAGWKACQSLNDERNTELVADHFKLVEIINGIDDADLTYKEGDSVNVKALKRFISATNARIAELEADQERFNWLIKYARTIEWKERDAHIPKTGRENIRKSIDESRGVK